LKVLISEARIRSRVGQMARAIDARYRNRRPVLIGILKGAVVFLSDLIRQMRIPVEIDFVTVASYNGRTSSSGRVKTKSELSVDLEGRDVILVEDIVDTGLTLRRVVKRLARKKPRSIAVCALLDKKDNRRQIVPIDFVGFEIPDGFVVGYGLDRRNRYRNLKFIGAVDGRKPKS